MRLRLDSSGDAVILPQVKTDTTTTLAGDKAWRVTDEAEDTQLLLAATTGGWQLLVRTASWGPEDGESGVFFTDKALGPLHARLQTAVVDISHRHIFRSGDMHIGIEREPDWIELDILGSGAIGIAPRISVSTTHMQEMIRSFESALAGMRPDARRDLAAPSERPALTELLAAPRQRVA